MSGIVGLINLAWAENEADVLHNTLQRMTSALAHRGPDGVGHWHNANAALGQRMLRTTPESSHENLPLCSRDQTLVLTCDARIDNRDELLPQLQNELLQVLADDNRSVVPDSALILAAYVKWGAECPKYLLGDFAFALWDESKKELFCARDHGGVKPFYYFHAPHQCFVCASEIKALFEVRAVPRRINETRVAEYLASALDDHQITFYEEILRLPAAHTLRVSQNGLQRECYWKPDADKRLQLGSDAEYDARFREVLFEAVRCRMRAPEAGEVGSFLSGGLDSSAVTCVAREIRGAQAEPLPVFSTVFDQISECDEREFMHAVLDGGGLEPHWIQGESRSALMDVEEMLWHHDEPFTAPNLCASWVEYQVARDNGIRVLLDGHGGDETIGYGYSRLNELTRAADWRTLWRELKALERNGFLQNDNTTPARVVFERISRHYAALRLARQAASKVKNLARPQRTENDVTTIPYWKRMVSAEFAARTDSNAMRQRADATEPTGECDDAQYNAAILGSALQSLVFEEVDKAAAAAGLEVRYPLWDKRVVEFCLSLPSDQKLRSGWSRLIIRRALEGVLPRKVQWRSSKVEFTADMRHGLRQHETARITKLATQSEIAPPFVDDDEVHRLCALLLSDEWIDAPEMQQIVRATCLSLWLQSESASKKATGDDEMKLKESETQPLRAETEFHQTAQLQDAVI